MYLKGQSVRVQKERGGQKVIPLISSLIKNPITLNTQRYFETCIYE